MSHEILTVKLCELDQKIGRLHSRIHLSESARHDQVKKELEDIRRECEEAEIILRKNLRFSKTKTISVLSDAYGEVERIIEKAKERIGNESSDNGNWRSDNGNGRSDCGDGLSDHGDGEIYMEERILMAEYALDFAMLAADHALLMSMEAIEAQMEQDEKEGI